MSKTSDNDIVVQIKLHSNENLNEILFDISDEFEILSSLIYSQSCDSHQSYDSYILIDYSGRVVESNQDILLVTNKSNDNYECEIWCISENEKLNYLSQCSKNVLSDQILQIANKFVDTEIKLCQNCCNFFDNTLIQTSKRLDSYICQCSQLVDLGFLDSSIITLNNSINIPYPIQLYIKRMIFNQSINVQKVSSSNDLLDFDRRLQSIQKTVMVYEDENQINIALNQIDYDLLIKYTDENLSNHPPDIALLYGLLQWFKCDKFSWCNKPKCNNTSCPTNFTSNPTPQSMEGKGMTEPNQYELQIGWGNRVELYQCNHCHTFVRFPRYNNPSYLLQCSPTGRCGEFANAFGLLCRAIGFDTRYVFDFTDHVWIEVYSVSLKRFIHIDSCERTLDSPLMYEQGWGKSLSLILSFSRYGIVDSTSRYTRKLNDVILKRQETIKINEIDLINKINQLDKILEENYLKNNIYNYEDNNINILPEDYYEALIDRINGFHNLRNKLNKLLNYNEINNRKYYLNKELDGMKFLSTNSFDLKIEELRGRISGDMEWKILRGENGKL